MRIETLSHFLKVAECKSYTRAASALFISQQGLSKSIAALEKELGAILFERNGKAVELTKQGRILLPFATEIVNLQFAATEALASDPQENPDFKTITVICMPYAGTRLLDLLESDMEAEKLTGFDMEEADYPDIITDVLTPNTLGICNIHSSLLKDIRESPDVNFIPFLSANLRLLASNSLVRGQENIVDRRTFGKLPLAYYNDRMLNRIVDAVSASERSEFEAAVFHTSNLNRILSLVKNGKAATFTDTFSLHLQPTSANMRVLKFENAVTFYVGFVVSKTLDRNAPQITFINKFLNMINTRYRAYMAKHPVP